jgi:hypothetical protein
MSRFYQPDLGSEPDSPFARDGNNKLVRRSGNAVQGQWHFRNPDLKSHGIAPKGSTIPTRISLDLKGRERCRDIRFRSMLQQRFGGDFHEERYRSSSARRAFRRSD